MQHSNSSNAARQAAGGAAAAAPHHSRSPALFPSALAVRVGVAVKKSSASSSGWQCGQVAAVRT
eukprot:CAMPEP_0119352464 /NCGR_PEP_ID=MMETSP1334-20130426/1733_1 /TAXON_ID=127549 /ORGANISM="Calcidiscus leptoporus, Strain RCC1130" /LENGTH=63 /DNA_ID=CAMNT_0007365523 /DNA_START=277 /DNA_END=468 /DNA_ORIENTATION=-